MAAVTGQNASISWIWSGGTTTLNTTYRTASYTPSVETYDQTSGPDTAKTYVVSYKDGQFTYSGLWPSGGTALLSALAEGNSGTIIYGPEGTASTKMKMTIPAISLGAVLNVQYNNLTEISANFQQNGARSDGTF